MWLSQLSLSSKVTEKSVSCPITLNSNLKLSRAPLVALVRPSSWIRQRQRLIKQEIWLITTTTKIVELSCQSTQWVAALPTPLDLSMMRAKSWTSEVCKWAGDSTRETLSNDSPLWMPETTLYMPTMSSEWFLGPIKVGRASLNTSRRMLSSFGIRPSNRQMVCLWRRPVTSRFWVMSTCRDQRMAKPSPLAVPLQTWTKDLLILSEAKKSSLLEVSTRASVAK